MTVSMDEVRAAIFKKNERTKLRMLIGDVVVPKESQVLSFAPGGVCGGRNVVAVTFGVPHLPMEFLDLAMNLEHPFARFDVKAQPWRSSDA